MSTSRTAGIVAIIGLVLVTQAQPSRWSNDSDAFRRIAQSPDHQAATKAAMSGLHVRAGDPHAVDHIAGIISDRTVWNQARWQLAELLLKTAEGSATASDRLVLRFQEWMDRPTEEDEGLKYAVASIIPNLDREPFLSAMCRAPRALDYVLRGYLQDPDSRPVWTKLFGRLPASSTKSAAALNIITSHPGDTGVPREVELALDAQALEELVRRANSQAQWHLFDLAAAKVLADLGDERVRAAIVRTSLSVGGRRAKEACDDMIERLDLQRSNERLVEYIGSGDLHSANETKRAWALGRAVDRGVARDQIRRALETYRENMAANRQVGSEGARRRLMASIRAKALEFGVLNAGEWPEYGPASR